MEYKIDQNVPGCVFQNLYLSAIQGTPKTARVGTVLKGKTA